jgi:hypothetical protein
LTESFERTEIVVSVTVEGAPPRSAMFWEKFSGMVITAS